MTSLPTTYELTTLAIAIQLPKVLGHEFDDCHEEDVRAALALSQFKACGKLLADVSAIEAKRLETTEEEREFLKKFDYGERVPLEKFLHAVMEKSKPSTRRRKWKLFRAESVRQNGYLYGDPATEAEFRRAVNTVLERDDDQGLDLRYVGSTRREFAAFLQTVEERLKSDKVEKSQRSKAIYSVGRLVREGVDLGPEQKAILTSMTPEEHETVHKKLEMDPKEIEKWKAAIVAMEAPENARPKKVKPQTNFFSDEEV
jgi:hypothetical protein